MKVMIVKVNEPYFTELGVKVFIELTKRTSYFVVSDKKFQEICATIRATGRNVYSLMSW
jgi:orotidine-5'-phosphate decarboxylase